MKSLHSFSNKMLVIIFVIISSETIHAGTRYKDIIFPSATVTKGIQYGSNVNIDGSNAALMLDLYQPANDTLKLRPLVICLHGGSLIVGDRIDMSAFCTDFAKRGYVAVSIDYRVGIESPKGVRTILEALLRGVQDTKAAVRFFRSKGAQYGIDTSQIFLEGSSAGSMVAVHYAYWNQDEIPPDINQAKWGNIEGASGNPGFSTAIKGIVNYCGSIIDPTWIDKGEVPVANFHGLLDTIVPPDSGVSGDFQIKMFGGVAISRAALQLGIYNQGSFFPQMGHGGNEDSLRVFGPNFFYSLMVLASSAPQDLTSLALSATSVKVFHYETYAFLSTVIDKSGNKIILPQPMIQYTCDTRIGTISPSGIFTPADRPDSGYVFAKFNGVTTSCFVKTYDFKYFIVKPKLAVIDTLRTLKLSVDTYDAEAVWHSVPTTKFAFVSTDPSVGTVDPTGVFTGKKSGTTKIIATLGGYSDTSVVRVEGASGLVSLDRLESLSGWTFDGLNLDSLSVTLAVDQKSAGNASFKIDYRFTYDPSKSAPMVYLNKALLLYGIPDSIYLDVKSDGRRHRLYYRFSDTESRLFRAFGAKFLNNAQIFDVINAPMTGLSSLSGTYDAVPPLTLGRIEIQLAGDNIPGQATSGTIYVDNLRLKYPGVVTDVEKAAFAPASFSLDQNYPNPFNPSTAISYQLPALSGVEGSANSFVKLKVFDVLGREVASLVNAIQKPGSYVTRWDASAYPTGVYLYRLQAGDNVQTKKMVLVK
ncbi:MAG: T9SS type A sorting domain-containing protein [Ignavibacteriales bacterium]|nr:T9SS type A sorting domain-containing protein [Ignavibacteriales bacterium]